MADNLIFPIGFDLEKGVIDAGKDADKYLRQLENTLRRKPIRLDVAIDGAAPGSIDAISKRMAALSTEFNKLAEAQRIYNRASGEFTPEAQKIIKEYAELTAATQTYAQSLSQITAAAKRQTQEQMKAQEQEIKRYEEYWKRKEAENAKQAQQEVANAERARKAQQQRISQEQAADTKRYQEWLRQKNQEAVETERVEQQKQQSRERTIAQQNREFAAQRQAEQQRQQAISASLRAEYQRIEAKKQAEAASRRELQMLNQQYAAEERRQRVAASQASVAKRQQVIKTLRAEENTIVNITAKLQHWQQVMNSSAMDGRQFRRATEEVQRLSQKLSEAQVRISQLTATTSNASARQSAAVRQVSQEFSKQDSYLTNLLKKTAALWSIHQVGSFLTNVREVTAQFELQRVSLGAIIQDQNKANQLFSEIKSFALKSPVSILDLTKYTKQLAAYKVGFDGLKTDTKELFEWTKRLTDVSVGLGVSMDRVVLAFGQVRATGYLRASEVRQFTEMGVPIVEELAAKLSKLNDEAVTAAQVMDMISKRGISFEMVKEVFDDMTAAGGIFYNMQEKQGNTLYGLWAKLGDAASVMYEQIGNTGFVNSTMKGTIQLLTDLMKNWKLVGREITVVAAGFALYKASTSLGTVSMVAASKATRDYARAQEQLNIAQKNNLSASVGAAKASMRAAAANRAAAMSTNVWTAAKYRLVGAVNSLKAALMGNWITIAITAIAAIGMAIYSAVEKANKLNNELAKIKEETGTLQYQSVRNFEYLANAAVNAADGSKAQKDALDELQRTYGNILPAETLKIENLRKLKGNYEELTQAVRAYIAAEQEQKAISAVNEIEGAAQVEMQKKLREAMTDKNLGGLALSDTEAQRFFIAFQKTSQDTSKTVREQFVEAFREAGLQGAEEMWKEIKNINKSRFTIGPGIFGSEEDNMKARSAIGELSRSFREQEEQIKGVREGYQQMTADLGVYTDSMIAYNKKVESEMNPGETMLQNQQNVNMQIVAMRDAMFRAFDDAGIEWKKEWQNLVLSVDPNDLNKTTTLNMEAILDAINPNKYPKLYKYISEYKRIYDGLIPSDPTVQQIQAKLFAISQSTGANIDVMRRFLWDGKTSVDDHLKSLNDQIDDYEAKLKRMQTTFANSGLLGSIASLFLKGQIDDTQKILEALKQQAEFVKTYTVPEKDKNKGRKSDTRLQELQEMYKTLKAINKEYDDLSKKEGGSQAASWVAENYESTLQRLNKLAKKFNLRFDFPLTPDNLQKYGKEIINKINSLKLKGGDKAVIDLQLELAKDTQARMEREIEQQLKNLQEKISRTKTAKEFYDKILTQTGDETLALQITYSIYPESGKDLYTEMQDQIRRVFDTGDALKNEKLKLRLGSVFDDKNERINYRELDKIYAEFQNDIIEKNRETAQKLIAEGQKTTAAQILNWEKELAKAKSYEEQRTDIINKAAEERAKIIKEVRDPKEQEKLLGLSREKESQGLAKVNFEEFTKSEDYVRIFENLDNVATSSLKHLREELQKVIDTNKDLSPENMKTLVKALGDIDDQIGERNPWDSLVSSAKEYVDSIKNIRQAKQELAAAEAEYKAQEPQLIADIETAKAEKETADSDVVEAQRQLLDIQNQMAVLRAQESVDALALADLKDREIAAENNLVSAKLRQNQAETNITKAVQNQANAQKKVTNAQEKVNETQDEKVEAENKFNKALKKGQKNASDMQSALQGFKDLLGDAAGEGTALGGALEGGIKAMETMQTIYGIIIALQVVYNAVTESNPWMAIAAAVLAVAGILAGAISGAKVAKANKEIEKQEELLDSLKYSYERLEDVMDKVFGGDYISNYQQQIRNLQAQQTAYLKQAEAERSKGKKEDEDKTKEYLKNAQETADKIKELQEDLTAHFTGSSRADTARQMAQSWIEARASMSDTFTAIKNDYADMIKNMIVEGAAARIIEQALSPMWNKMDAMLKKNDIDAAIDALVGGMDSALSAANNGMEVLWKALEARGYDMKQLVGDVDSSYTGIAKNIASATSEEINAVAAIGNTLMYYVSPIPRIDENLARVVAIMEGRGATLPAASGTTVAAKDYTELFNTANGHLSSLPRMEQHLAEIHTLLDRALRTKGSTTGFNTFLNS